MLSIDHLQEISLELERTKIVDRGQTVAELNAYLADIYDHPSYAKWLEIDQFGGAAHASGRFTVPAEIGIKHLDAKRILDRYLLTVNRELMVKIDKHFNRIHLTDGFWVDPRIRVYPTPDESEQLCGYIKSTDYEANADVLIDPACGCGHHGMALNVPIRVSMDVSVRALTYCVLNAVLSDSQRQLYALNDIRGGLPDLLSRYLAGRVLFAANMPFAVFPRFESGSSPSAQDGGTRGVALTFAAMEAVAKLWREARSISELRAVILFYSLGRTENGPWEVEERAEKMFGLESVSTKILSDEKMWRVNGKKEQPNPMPIDKLEEKAACRFTWAEYEEQNVREAYKARQQEFKDDGWTHLGYGVLDIVLRR